MEILFTEKYMNRHKITGSASVLLVSNVVNSAEWYRDKLGFSFEKYWGDPPSFCILERDGYRLMISQVNDKLEIKPNWKIVDKMWNVYFWVNDAESMYKELKDRGAIIDYELYTTLYNVKEFGVIDPDGYDIAFGEILKS